MKIINKFKSFFKKQSYAKKFYKKRKGEGLCPFCKKPSNGFYACESCRIKRAKYYKKKKKESKIK